MFRRSIICSAVFALTASTALAQTVDSLQRSAKDYADTDWGGHFHTAVYTDGRTPRRADPQSRQLPHRRVAYTAGR